VPGGNIPRVETKKRECWKFLDWRLNSENDSRVHGQPSFTGSLLLLTDYSFSAFSFVNRIMFHHRCYSRSSSPLNGSSTWFTFLSNLSLTFPLSALSLRSLPSCLMFLHSWVRFSLRSFFSLAHSSSLTGIRSLVHIHSHLVRHFVPLAFSLICTLSLLLVVPAFLSLIVRLPRSAPHSLRS